MSHPVNRVAENPLTHALRVLGMTRTSFGVKYNLSRQYLLRVSQGRSNMTDYIKRSLLEEADIRGLDFFPDLDASWDRWLHEHRSQQTLPAPVKDKSLSPFARLVKATGGASRMAAILAAPDTLVSRYLNGNTRGMPTAIREALDDMGYPYREELERSMDEWSKRH